MRSSASAGELNVAAAVPCGESTPRKFANTGVLTSEMPMSVIGSKWSGSDTWPTGVGGELPHHEAVVLRTHRAAGQEYREPHAASPCRKTGELSKLELRPEDPAELELEYAF